MSTPTDRELMQQALDTLELAHGLVARPVFEDAIAALRTRLARPEAEPFGCVAKDTRGYQQFYPHPLRPYLDTAVECVVVYTHPPAPTQPEAEPSLRQALVDALHWLKASQAGKVSGINNSIIENVCSNAEDALLAHPPAPTPAVRPLDNRVGEEWTPCMKLPVTVHVRKQRSGETHVSTREGLTPLLPTDLIMRGVEGEEYPIGYDLFARTYRVVKEGGE